MNCRVFQLTLVTCLQLPAEAKLTRPGSQLWRQNTPTRRTLATTGPLDGSAPAGCLAAALNWLSDSAWGHMRGSLVCRQIRPQGIPEHALRRRRGPWRRWVTRIGRCANMLRARPKAIRGIADARCGQPRHGAIELVALWRRSGCLVNHDAPAPQPPARFHQRSHHHLVHPGAPPHKPSLSP